jgi:hypothetical protein
MYQLPNGAWTTSILLALEADSNADSITNQEYKLYDYHFNYTGVITNS